MPLLSRKSSFVEQLHGSIPYHELRSLGLKPSDIFDFSATVNPFPLPEIIHKRIAEVELAHYPDTECYEAAGALSEFNQIPREWIVVTAGITESIYMLPCIYKKAICLTPTYGDYSAAYKKQRREITKVSFPRNGADFGKTLDILRQKPFRLFVVCNPNNPDGSYLPLYRIQELCECFSHATICIDESYQEMGKDCDSAIGLTARFRNLLVLKSLTKPFGIGGVRAAYAISSGGVLKKIRKMQLPWGVSAIAQNIIPDILKCRNIFEQQWASILEAKKQLMNAFQELGVATDKSCCPFFLAEVGNAPRFRKVMLNEYRIAVRDCTSFGMPGRVRIMPSVHEKNKVLLTAFRSYL
jgi:threonine-phosphate decarboxylase